MKFVVLNGSVRKGRKSVNVSRFIYERLSAIEGCEVELLDILDYNFPVMEERMKFLEQVPDNMKKFSEAMDEADGLIIVTPEYNGSYSGALKNTLDYFKTEYEQKSMGLVTVSAGKMGGANAMHHLQAWAIHVKGIVSPFKLYVGNVGDKFTVDGDLLDLSLNKSVDNFLDKFLWLSKAISGLKE